MNAAAASNGGDGVIGATAGATHDTGDDSASGDANVDSGDGGAPSNETGDGGEPGDGGAAGAPCGAGDCLPWVQVGGALPPAYSFALAASPTKTGVAYTGNDSFGSVFKTTNAGASWFPASTGIDGDGVSALAVDPFDADYVWAGTPGGLFRSANAGASWTKVPVDSDLPRASWITVDPVVKGRVYVLLNGDARVASWSAAYVSDDRGGSWRRLEPPVDFRGNTLDVDSSDPKHLFLGTYGQGVLESHDGGASFQPLPSSPEKGIYQVVYEPASKLLCAVVDSGIARSLDGGVSWQTTKNVPAFVLTLAPGPTFYVDGNVGVFRSTDCSTWTNVDKETGYRAVVDAAGGVYTATLGRPGRQGVRYSPDGVSAFVDASYGITTCDVTDIALDGAGGLFVDTGYFGIFHSTDGAASFSSASGDLGLVGTTAFPSALVNAGKTLFAYSRSMPGRLYRSEDQGNSWSGLALAVPGSAYNYVLDVLPSPTFATDNEVYVDGRSAQGQTFSFQQSLDGGASFAPYGETDFGTARMLWDKLHPGWLWALGVKPPQDASNVNLYLSKDAGTTWSEVALPVDGSYAALEATATATGEVLYVWVYDKGLLRSDDAGATWQLMGTLPGALFSLAIDPTNPDIVYASIGSDGQLAVAEQGLFKSRDGGATWSHVDRGIKLGTVRQLVIEPNDPQIVYAGMVHGGLYKTTSAGE